MDNYNLFVSKNITHLNQMYSIIEFYYLDISKEDFYLMCYKNSTDYLNGKRK